MCSAKGLKKVRTKSSNVEKQLKEGDNACRYMYMYMYLHVHM